MDYYEYRFPVYRPDAVFSAVITAKGYLTLPEECFTDTDFVGDGDDVILTSSWIEGVLTVYTKAFFEQVDEQLGHLNQLDFNVRRLRRMIIGEACYKRIDKEGRIDVDAEFCSRLGFDLDKAEQGGFPVKILKYKDKIWIATLPAYEEIEKKLQEQDNETP